MEYRSENFCIKIEPVTIIAFLQIVNVLLDIDIATTGIPLL